MSECGEITKADQCDNCGHTPSVEELKDGVCLSWKQNNRKGQ